MNRPIFIPIVPYTETTVKHIASFSVEVISVVLNLQATVLVKLFDSDKKFIECKTLIMSGSDYQNWGTSDTYVNQFVARSLGFSLS